MTRKVMLIVADKPTGNNPPKPWAGGKGSMSTGKQHLSLKQSWLTWRARLSIPSLIASRDERKIISMVVALNGGVAILLISLLAWIVDLPLLFPALGPSAFILFSSPFSSAAAPRSVIMGHFIAIAVGLAVWLFIAIICGRPVMPGMTGWPVLVSASMSLAITCLLLVWLSVPHAPSCATGLIIALGLANEAASLLGMLAGVVLLTIQALVINRLADVSMPAWSPRHEDRLSEADRA
jgi:CBS domain-containing membrane protein